MSDSRYIPPYHPDRQQQEDRRHSDSTKNVNVTINLGLSDLGPVFLSVVVPILTELVRPLIAKLNQLGEIKTMTQELLDTVDQIKAGQSREDAAVTNLVNQISTVATTVATDFQSLKDQLAALEASAGTDPDVATAIAGLKETVDRQAANADNLDLATNKLAEVVSATSGGGASGGATGGEPAPVPDGAPA